MLCFHARPTCRLADGFDRFRLHMPPFRCPSRSPHSTRGHQRTGGVCISFAQESTYDVCPSSAPCPALVISDNGLEVTGDLAFDKLAVGQSGTRTLQVANLLSVATSLGVTVDEPAFRSGWSSVELPASSTRSLAVRATCEGRGQHSGTLVIKADERQELRIAASVSCGGALVSVQSFVDAGLVTPSSPRVNERRALRVQNVGVPNIDEPVRAQVSVPVRIDPASTCMPLAVLPASFSAQLTADINPGQAGVVDLFVTPMGFDGTPSVCPVQVQLGGTWHPVTVVLTGNLAAQNAAGRQYSLSATDGGIDVVVQGAFSGGLYLSWPRLERPDAGLRLIADWDEAIVSVGMQRILRVEQTAAFPELPNAVLIDGNGNGGTFRYAIVP